MKNCNIFFILLVLGLSRKVDGLPTTIMEWYSYNNTLYCLKDSFCYIGVYDRRIQTLDYVNSCVCPWGKHCRGQLRQIEWENFIALMRPCIYQKSEPANEPAPELEKHDMGKNC